VLTLIIGTLLAFPVHPAAASGADTRASLDAQYRADLQQLAAKCDELGLEQQAAISRAWCIQRDPRRYYLFLPATADPTAPGPQVPQLVKFWHAKFTEYRRDHAKKLFDLARRSARHGGEAVAFRLLYEVLREDPDHALARRILGYRKTNQGWSETLAKPRSRRIRGRHPVLAPNGGTYRRIDTTHFQIVTDAESSSGRRAAEYLEQVYLAWHQLFYGYWSKSGQLAAAFQAPKSVLVPARKHQVVLFKDRDQYVRQLQRYEQQIAMSTGYYSQEQKMAFFYAGDPSVRPNWAHETTHQLFQETRTARGQVGDQTNFWAIEGVAMYMESLVSHDSYFTTGGVDAERLQYARYRALNQQIQRPLAKLVTYGRTDLQHDPDVRQLYSQSAGLTHFFLHTDRGRLFTPFVKYLATIYRQADDAQTLHDLAGTDYAELDRQYLAFLNVTDKDLARVNPRCRKLCLGHTAVTDQGLQLLDKATRLEWLDLSFTAAGDRGLAFFAACDRLNQLNLEKTRITDASLQTIGRFKDLEELDLSRTAITDAGLDAIARLTRLKILWLTGTRITDQGLRKLEHLKQLEQLEVDETNVKPAGLSALRRKLPKLKP